jgi:hypothetical protein
MIRRNTCCDVAARRSVVTFWRRERESTKLTCPERFTRTSPLVLPERYENVTRRNFFWWVASKFLGGTSLWLTHWQSRADDRPDDRPVYCIQTTVIHCIRLKADNVTFIKLLSLQTKLNTIKGMYDIHRHLPTTRSSVKWMNWIYCKKFNNQWKVPPPNKLSPT